MSAAPPSEHAEGPLPAVDTPDAHDASPPNERLRVPPGPPDSFELMGNALDNHAPIWRVYRDEMTKFDKQVVLAEWNMILDVLLVFAGLLSIVVSIFLGTIYPNLQPQNNAAATLHALITSINDSLGAPTLVLPALSTEVPPLYRAIHGLWLTSLFLSLSTAFLAIFGRQWLEEYNQQVLLDTTPSATWARKRQVFSTGLRAWHTSGFITLVLPIILHIALILFLVGLSLLTWTVDRAIAAWAIAMTVLLATFYWGGIYLLSQWPTGVTYAALVRRGHIDVITALLATMRLLRPRDRNGPGLGPTVHPTIAALVEPTVGQVVEGTVEPRIPLGSLLQRLHAAADRDTDARLRVALLQFVLSGPDTASLEAYKSLAVPHLTRSDFMESVELESSGMHALEAIRRRSRNRRNLLTDIEVVRAIRIDLWLRRVAWNEGRLDLETWPAMQAVLWGSQLPAAKLLVSATAIDFSPIEDDILRWFAVPPNDASILSSIATLLFYCNGRMPPSRLLYLLLLVDFYALQAQEYRLISSHCCSLLNRSPLVVAQHSAEDHQCGTICIASLVASIVFGHESAVHVGDRAIGQLLIAHVFCHVELDPATIAAISPYAAVISQFVVDHIKRQAREVEVEGEREGERERESDSDSDSEAATHAGGRSRRNAQALWGAGNALRFILKTLAPEDAARNGQMINPSTQSIAKGLETLVMGQRGLSSEWLIQPAIWYKALAALIQAFSEKKVNADISASDQLALATSLAAGIQILDWMDRDVQRLIPTFRTGVKRVLSATTLAFFSENGIHLAQHYRDLLRDSWEADLQLLLNPETNSSSRDQAMQSLKSTISAAGGCEKCPGVSNAVRRIEHRAPPASTSALDAD